MSLLLGVLDTITYELFCFKSENVTLNHETNRHELLEVFADME